MYTIKESITIFVIIYLGYNRVQSSLLYIDTLGLLYTLLHFGTQGYTQLQT